jgi:hypothetical protein
MKISLDVLGQSELEDVFTSLVANVERKALIALTDAAFLVHGEAIKSIAEKGSGSKTVTRYNPRREQLVSDPGNPPNTDLGTLVQNIQFEVDAPSLTALVGTNLLYGKYLEFGTTNMKARPWLFPAFEKCNDGIMAIFIGELGKENLAA